MWFCGPVINPTELPSYVGVYAFISAMLEQDPL